MAAESAPAEECNSVRVSGRLAAAPQQRTLPSGDELTTFRLVVRRPEPRGRGPAVDTLDCVTWRGDVRRTVGRWRAGDVVAVEGSLRRRFWRSAGGPASRTEIEVVRARRLARA
ncbi:MAG: single-stranded DNA-binding protein [Actinomycetia bacterium]|nr:single-stranded DNA-binding protein [Actinomycetes bacterium]